MSSELPLVGVVMGSDSDFSVMEAAVTVLRDFGVAHEVQVVSAHRTPEKMIEYGRSARSRGLRVIIAGAGGAAHLPGMLAAVTTLPVIGVPVPLARLDGMDSLLSIVQMPAGIPVATVSIGGAANAALLAVQILAASAPAPAGSAPAPGATPTAPTAPGAATPATATPATPGATPAAPGSAPATAAAPGSATAPTPDAAAPADAWRSTLDPTALADALANYRATLTASVEQKNAALQSRL